MENHAVRQIRYGLRRRDDIDQDGFAAENAAQRFVIGLVDDLQRFAFFRTSCAAELIEKAGKVRIPACRRAPTHMRNLRVEQSKVRGEYLESDVDHARRRGKQVTRNVAVFFRHRCLRFPAALGNMPGSKRQRQYPGGMTHLLSCVPTCARGAYSATR
jgi:hypothetical protein